MTLALKELQHRREVLSRIWVVGLYRERFAEVLDRFLELTERRERHAKIVMSVGNARIERQRLAEMDDRLGEIAAPTLIIAGERDFMCGPGVGAVMAKGIRGAKLVTIAGSGHFAHLETPEAFEGAIVDFLPRLR